jgi:hypothetical protein
VTPALPTASRIRSASISSALRSIMSGRAIDGEAFLAA